MNLEPHCTCWYMGPGKDSRPDHAPDCAIKLLPQPAPRYSDAQLVSMFMRQWREAKRGGQSLCSRVMEAFGVGSTAAAEICRAHGMDPDMQTRQRRL